MASGPSQRPAGLWEEGGLELLPCGGWLCRAGADLPGEGPGGLPGARSWPCLLRGAQDPRNRGNARSSSGAARLAGEQTMGRTPSTWSHAKAQGPGAQCWESKLPTWKQTQGFDGWHRKAAPGGGGSVSKARVAFGDRLEARRVGQVAPPQTAASCSYPRLCFSSPETTGASGSNLHARGGESSLMPTPALPWEPLP